MLYGRARRDGDVPGTLTPLSPNPIPRPHHHPSPPIRSLTQTNIRSLPQAAALFATLADDVRRNTVYSLFIYKPVPGAAAGAPGPR